MKKRYLILQDGSVFEGLAFGADIPAIGELVFTTGMCGYIETLTDPSYYGQIVTQTFPLIGNYGIINTDFEGNCHIKGYVVHEVCDNPSNFRTDGTVDEFLKKNCIPGISGVDTRKLTRIIREYGVMNAIISDDIPKGAAASTAIFEQLKNYAVTDAVKSVSKPVKSISKTDEEIKYKVVLMDFGAKSNIERCLLKRGCEVICVPYNTTANEILSMNPDGIMLSNGPGDPAENTDIIKEIKYLFGKVPMFGICLGHQLLALSQNAKTYKLKYGHRGTNQPVKDLLTGRTYITSQNHGYAVNQNTLINGKLRWINANDETCEGIDYDNGITFSVQFHPEACSGPKDTEFLFDRFCDIMKKGRN